MAAYVTLKLEDGRILQVNVLSKTLTSLVVRTNDNKYLLVSRDFIVNKEDFKFKD